MPAIRDDYIYLRDKIEWEGGLAEYVLHYGGGFPDRELHLRAERLRVAYNELQAELEETYDELGIKED